MTSTDRGDTSGLGRYVLIGLAFLAVILMIVLLKPFASALLFAGVLAAVFSRWLERLSARLRHRRRLAAGLLTATVALVVVLPVSVLAVVVAKQGAAGVAYLKKTIQSDGVHGLIEDLPPSLKGLASDVVGGLPGGEAQLEELAGGQTGKAAAAVGGVLLATTQILFQIVMMLIALYFMLAEGPALVEWITYAMPLRPSQTRELLRDFRKVSEGVMVSSFATAGAQSVVALAGFLLARAPQPFFLASLTFFAAFIPAVGAGTVPVATALFLYSSGHSSAALFLAVWGSIVVGFTDNIVKPLLMRSAMEVHGGVVFFALLGGMAVFGVVGLVAGPLILAFFLAVVRMCHRDLAVNHHAGPVPQPAPAFAPLV